jgi:hypothetical protein
MSEVELRSMSEVELRSMSEVELRSMSEVELRSMSEVELPDKITMTFHPQRWNDSFVPWLSEFVSQKLKNQVKCLLVKVWKKQVIYGLFSKGERHTKTCSFDSLK